MQKQALVKAGVPSGRLQQASQKKQKKPKSQKKKAKELLAEHSRYLEVTRDGFAYIRLVLDPERAPLAHFPWGYPVRSQLIRVFASGNATSGASGNPFICVRPYAAISNQGNFVYYTDSSYTGSGATALNAASTGVSTAASNSSYNDSSLNNESMEFRLLAASLRFGAVSSLTTRSGSIVYAVEPSHSNYISQNGGTIVGQSFDQIQSTLGTKREPVPMDSSERTLIWGTPETDGEAGWTSYFSISENLAYLQTMGLSGDEAQDYIANDPSTAHWKNACMVAFATGAGGTSFEWSAHAVFEIKGRTVLNVTGSRADPDAYSAVAGFLTSSPYRHTGRHTAAEVGRWALEQTGFITPDGNVHWGNVSSAAGKAASLLL